MKHALRRGQLSFFLAVPSKDLLVEKVGAELDFVEDRVDIHRLENCFVGSEMGYGIQPG